MVAHKRPPRPPPPKLARSAVLDQAITDVVIDWAGHFKLTGPEETLLLEATTRGTADRDVLARARRVTTDTIKSQVRSVLRRTGAPTLAHASLCIFSEALLHAINRS